jgi:MOSC domain-containing protein YiiM
MKVKSVNIGPIKEVTWRGKILKTGIFKSPVSIITLGNTDVFNDNVVDRKYHGGIEKACYIYSTDHYLFWKKLYPQLNFEYGMFGENITVDDLNETKIYIGDIYRIGGATIQVTQPREPCFKLGIRFGTQKIIKQFINNDYPGIYVKVLEGDDVKAGDKMELVERQHNTLSLIEVWHLLYDKDIDEEDLEFALEINTLSDSCKKSLRKRIPSL